MNAQTELSRLNLQDDYAQVLGLQEAERWVLANPGPLEVWVTLYSAKDPLETFQARLLWSAYPSAPPSLKFRNPSTGRLDVSSAWPRVRGFRPQSLDACVTWTAEGMALHPQWKTDPRYRWDPRGNVLLKVLRILQDEMDFYYDGRYKP